MATQEQILQIIRQLDELRPAPFLAKVNESHAGIGAVMRLLTESEKSVTAGDVAEFMGVSTARVAVLLKKMEARGLIVREKSPHDARVTIVELSEEGRKLSAALQADMHHKVEQIIDRVGMDRLLDFLDVAKEISRIAPPPGADCPAQLICRIESDKKENEQC